jgi:hypothetical protein
LLALPSQNRNHHGQHGHGGAILTKFKKNATSQQSTRKKLYGPVPIIVLLRLAPRDCWGLLCWAKMRVAMVSGMCNNFVFVMPSFKHARGSKFQKMQVEFYVNILACACSAQETDKNAYFLDNFLAHLQDQYLRSWRFRFAGNAFVTCRITKAM